jgi:osmotically-inducible protein OsmY
VGGAPHLPRKAAASEEVVSRDVRAVKIAGVMVIVLVVAGCSGSSTRPVDETVTDATVTSVVRARLDADSELSPFRIGVSTRDAVVTLTGRVEREAQRDRAGSLAGDVEGVEAVKNLIRVGGREPAARRSNV